MFTNSLLQLCLDGRQGEGCKGKGIEIVELIFASKLEKAYRSQHFHNNFDLSGFGCNFILFWLIVDRHFGVRNFVVAIEELLKLAKDGYNC